MYKKKSLIERLLNQLSFCSRSSFVVCPITCVYVKYLAEGSLNEPETNCKGESSYRFLLHLLWSGQQTDDVLTMTTMRTMLKDVWTETGALLVCDEPLGNK